MANIDWNYRILKADGYLQIHEVYYDETGEPSACTDRCVSPCGEDIAELEEDVKKYVRALTLPVLDIKIFTRKKNREWFQKQTR